MPEFLHGECKCTSVVGDPSEYLSTIGIPYVLRRMMKTANYGVGVQSINWTVDKAAGVFVHTVKVRSPVKNVDLAARIPLNGDWADFPTPDGGKSSVKLQKVDMENHYVDLSVISKNRFGGRPQQMRFSKVDERTVEIKMTADGVSFARRFTRQ